MAYSSRLQLIVLFDNAPGDIFKVSAGSGIISKRYYWFYIFLIFLSHNPNIFIRGDLFSTQKQKNSNQSLHSTVSALRPRRVSLSLCYWFENHMRKATLIFILVALLISLFIFSPLKYTLRSVIWSAPPNKDIYPLYVTSHTFPSFIPIFSDFGLTFRNNGDTPIKDCIITFESEYTAKLHQLKRWNPDARRSFPPISDIPPNACLVFEFSDDVGNWWELRDSKGDKYPFANGPPRTINIESSNFPEMKWKLYKDWRSYIPIQ